MIELLNCDCMEYMATLPDKAFDLAIVDPPYGIMENGGQSGGCVGHLKDRIFNEFMRAGSEWDKAPDKTYFDELFRISQNQIIWGGNYFELPISRCWIVWDKCQPWLNFSQVELAWTSFNKPTGLFKFDNRTGDKIHPTQKPIALYKWLLKTYATADMKIIDTHLGSGSSAIAAYDFGCEFVGMEIDKDYYDAAVKRFNIYKMQTKLF